MARKTRCGRLIPGVTSAIEGDRIHRSGAGKMQVSSRPPPCTVLLLHKITGQEQPHIFMIYTARTAASSSSMTCTKTKTKRGPQHQRDRHDESLCGFHSSGRLLMNSLTVEKLIGIRFIYRHLSSYHVLPVPLIRWRSI